MKFTGLRQAVILHKVITFLTVFFLSTTVNSQDYDPHFWCWPYTSKDALDIKTGDMKWLKEQGWYGIGVSPATNEPGGKYYFKSPTLASQSWATFEGDRTTPLINAAHADGLKFMANMEWINPNFWPEGLKYWTPDMLKGIVKDLKDSGIDRWFDECFNLWAELGSAIAEQCMDLNLEYEEGSDGMHIFGTPAWQRGKLKDENLRPTYPKYYANTNPISLYHYGYYRDISKGGIIAQQGTPAYGFAKHWNKKTALVYTMGNWGTPSEYWPGILRATCLIRSLQFRIDDYMIIKADSTNGAQLNIPALKSWISGYINKQDALEKRPVLNLVTHLTGDMSGAFLWGLYTFSGDAITSAAFHAGYNVICSEEPIPQADAYYVYTSGTYGATDNLPPEITDLFSTKKTVFLQCGGSIPSGADLTDNWKTALNKCGVDWKKSFQSSQEMPLSGTYKGKNYNFTGISSMKDAPGSNQTKHGTLIPEDAIKGKNYSQSGNIPLIVGQNGKYLITGSCLNWQMNYVIADLLNGYGTSPGSNVWGIAGNGASAFLAIDNTTLELRIPNLPDGQNIHVVQFDKYYNKIYDAKVKYVAPYTHSMNQFDLMTIESDFKNNMLKSRPVKKSRVR